MIHSSVLTHLSIRTTPLLTLPHQKSSLIPLNSHPCAKSRSNSLRITSLRKNTPGGGFIPILEPSTSEPSNLKTSAPIAAPSLLESALTNVCENKQLQIQQNPHLREFWGEGGASPRVLMGSELVGEEVERDDAEDGERQEGGGGDEEE
jgi:hypothetical protein